MKRLLTILCCAVLLPFIGVAQSFEEYKKQEQAKMQHFAKEQSEGMERLRKEYAEYVAKRDQEWSDYLKKEWSNYAAQTGKKIPSDPKPQNNPVYKPSANESTADQPVIKSSGEGKKIMPPIPVAVEPIRKPAEAEENTRTAMISFYGKKYAITYDLSMSRCSFPSVNQENISRFWDQLSQSNYTPAIDRLLQSKADMNSNDYGYLLLVQDFSKNVYPSNANAAHLMTWFIMVRSGYAVRIGYNQNDVVLLIPSLEQIYQKDFLNIDGVKYYVFPTLAGSSFYTYDKDYAPGKQIDFRISAPINFSGRKSERKVNFKFEDKDYQISLAYDPDLIEFYKTYPQMSFEVYFDAAASIQAKESIFEALQPVIADMDEITAVNFLLRFVQTAFPYKTDPDQFGREKYFFTEEVFYYPYCDCEDRSVLFSYLVGQLKGLKTIGLEYPGHMATAVSFHSPCNGSSITYNGDKYVVADPTFINAPVGLCMPAFRNTSPIVHQIDNNNGVSYSVGRLWEKMAEMGCYKGSIRKNAKLLPDKSIVMTGYFSEPVQLGPFKLSGNAKAHNGFITKINSSGTVVWAKAFKSTANAVCMSVETTSTGNILVAGVFTGSIGFAGKSLNVPEGKSDLFIACLSPDGDLQWFNRGGLEALPQETYTAFTSEFSAKGSKIATKHAEQEIEESMLGLFVEPNDNIIYSGMLNNALAVAGNTKPVAFASEENVDISSLIKEEETALKAKQVHPSMAGLLAAVNLVNNMGLSLTGIDVQKALDKNNPGFKSNCPNIYKNFGNINFVRNSQGIISIMTVNKKDISFDKVKITNGSTVSISEMGNGNYKMEALSGVKVGMAVVWFTLNFIKMETQNGDLIFDYASDHSQVTVNLQKDILE